MSYLFFWVVLTIPKPLRIFFKTGRRLLGEL